MSSSDQPTCPRAQRKTDRRACPRRRRRRRRTRQVGYTLLGLGLGLLAVIAVVTRSPLATRLIVPRLSDMTSTPITADRAYLGLDGSIVLEGAKFYVPGMARPTEVPGPEARFFEVDRAAVWMDWGSIFSSMPVVDRIDLERPLFRLCQSTETGRLNIASLSFLMQDAGLGDVPDDFHLPVLATEGGVIEIGEFDDAGYTMLKRIPVDGDLVPMALPGGQTFGFRLRQVTDTPGRRGIDLSGRYDERGLAITIDTFVLSDWSSDVVPSSVRDLYERLELSGAIGATTLRVSPSGKPSATMTLEGVGLTLPFDLRGAVATEDAALRMEDTTGTIEVSPEGVHAVLAGTLDELAYRVELDSDGVEPTSPFRCVLTTDTRLSPDMRLLFTAPEAVLEPLGFFIEPRADVAAEIRLERAAGPGGEPGPIRKTGEFRFSNGSAAYRNFPYRFEQIEGVARFDDTTLSIDALRGTHPNGAVLSATGTFAPLGPESEVVLHVRVEDVPVDDELRAAMSPARRRMVDALFSERRYRELLAAGLVVTPEEAARREAREATLREELAAWPAGGIARSQRSRLMNEVARLEATGQEAPAFAFGGRADVDITIRRAFGREGIWTRTIDVNVPRAGLVADHFPLPMIAENVGITIDEGRAHLSGGVYRGLTGGSAQVEAHVALVDAEGNSIPDPIPNVEIRASAIPIGPRLRAAIPGYGSSEPGTPGTLRDMLDRLGLEGVADCEALIAARPDGSLGYEVRAKVDGMTSRPRPAAGAHAAPGPLTLTDVGGTIEVNERVVALDLQGGLVFEDADPGLAEPSPFRLNAKLGYQRERPGFTPAGDRGADGPPAPGAELDVLVEAGRLDLETPLHHAVSVFSAPWGERVRGWVERYRPDGLVGASARFEGRLGGELFAEVKVSDVERASWGVGGERVDIGRSTGAFTLRTGPEPWIRAEGVSAPMWYGRERVGTVRADGVLPLVRAGEAAGGGWAWDERMEVSVDGAAFESAFTRAFVASRLDGATRETIASREPTGTYDLRLAMRPVAGEGGAGAAGGELTLPVLDLSGSLGPRTLAFDHAGQRVDLGLLDGWLRFEPGGGVIDNLSVDADGWRGHADGRWTRAADGAGRIEAAMDVTSEDGLAPGLAALLPAAVNDAIGALAIDASGVVSARDVVLTLDRGAGEGGAWWYDAAGEVVFDGARLDAGVEISELSGSMRFGAGRRAGEARGSFAIEVDAERGRLAGVRFTDGRAEARSARGGGTEITRAQASVHGGRLAGTAVVEDGSYRADFAASGVRAAPVFDDLGVAPEPEEPAAMTARADPEAITRARREDARAWNNTTDLSRGVIEGSFSLSGETGDLASRSGRGSVQVTGGRVVELPGLLQLIEFSNLQAPVGERLSNAQASFYVEGPTLTFEQVSVFSSSVEIFGYGTMTMPGRDLELQFNSRSVNPIPVVSKLIEGLRDELITTRVRGTPGELEFTTEQLPGARRIIRSIFGEGPSQEERRMRDVESRARQGQARAARTAARAADQAAMPAQSGTVVRDGGDGAGAPTLVVQPTDDE